MARRSLKATVVTATLFAAAFSAQPAQGAPSMITDPPPDKIVIDVATVNGSGCPEGTAKVAVAEDNTAFTVTYSDYLAQVGPNSKPTDRRKNCQLNLIVHVPQGFTYAIVSADYRGYAYLQPGASGLQKASYYFQGSSDTAATSHPFNGPRDGNWQATDSTDWGQLVWKPCGEQRNFNVNTEIRVDSGTSDPAKTSFMTMDSTDGDIKTTYHFAWKTCPTS
ncbi:DUF4360 domain-containing protein [Streptomyces spirodelae]|uniref:DUF4360 domain-containing protein n=1 Tax=Streptomyces spirodelae TaxID=2812904 RepID=A0ABS3WM59_9ACTN|nr:DUF4360 domain-containing protein [Streptomyces spirodelae]